MVAKDIRKISVLTKIKKVLVEVVSKEGVISEEVLITSNSSQLSISMDAEAAAEHTQEVTAEATVEATLADNEVTATVVVVGSNSPTVGV